MAQKITETSKLVCDKETKISQLKVTSHSFSKVNNKLVATEKDKEAEINIPSFGVCSISQSRCTASVIKWDKTSKNVINDFKVLTEVSTCQCVLGGGISIQDSGHQEKHSTT